MTAEGLGEAAEEAGALTACGGGRVLSRGGWGGVGCPVASSSAANVVGSSCVGGSLAGCLAFELFVEGEDSTFGGVADISCSSSAGAEFGGGLRKTLLEVRGWSGSNASFGCLWCLDGVASSSASRVSILSDGWVWLGDLVRHVVGGWL